MSDQKNPLVIPRLPSGESVWKDYPVVGKPGWWKCTDTSGNPLKPLIRCNCGSVSGIGLHHVHADGTVTNSFYHQRGDVYPQDPKGCEWHVWLKLDGWDMGDIPPDKK
jgi:hypothetical protein